MIRRCSWSPPIGSAPTTSCGHPDPRQGRVLTATSFFWFEHLAVPNHLAGGPTDERIPSRCSGARWWSTTCRWWPWVRGTRLPDRVGAVGLQRDRRGLRNRVAGGLGEASKLPEPIFTPASKAELGDHDENITYEQVVSLVGADLAADLRAATLTSTVGVPTWRLAAGSSSPTPVRVRPGARWVAGAGRRGVTPDLVALPGRGNLCPRAGAAVVRQADRAQLADRAGAGLGPQIEYIATSFA